MSKFTRIAIVGTEGTGKTVLLAVLANALTSTKSLPRITGENMRTRRYTAEVLDVLENGKWPSSTPMNVTRELKWSWHDRDGDPHELGTFDCAGQDFRAIFEAENDESLNDKQRALQDKFHNCDLILLLLNLQDALGIYQKPGTGLARIDIEYAPSAAIRKLREAGITLYAVFTQADRYDERIRREWSGNYSNALRDLLPELYRALEETGSPFSVIHAVETEDVHGEIVPKKERNAAALGEIIRSVDDFLAKRKEEARQAELAVKEAAAQKKADEERRLREDAAREREWLMEKTRQREESAKWEAQKLKRRWGFAILFLVVSMAVGVFDAAKNNLKQEQERVERVAREEKAAAEIKRRAEEEQRRIKQEQAERKAREEKAAAEAAAEARKLAEENRIRAEKERAERIAREEAAAAAARKLAEENRIRIEQERAERKAREEKAAAQARAEAEVKKRAEEERLARIVQEEEAAAKFAEKIKNALAFNIPALDMDMQRIPPGSFTMGSPEDEKGRFDNEPQRRVTISKPFWLGRYEVTQAQWTALMGSNPSFFQDAALPVEQVSWADAMRFCRRLSETERLAGRLPTGYRYTLPTEAKWEYACRAGITGRFGSSGELADMGWHKENSEGKTHRGGLKRANAWGLYDMHGNVLEWCSTGNDERDLYRFVRGGGWDSEARFCRAAYRYASDRRISNKFLGFRVALSPDGE